MVGLILIASENERAISRHRSIFSPPTQLEYNEIAFVDRMLII